MEQFKPKIFNQYLNTDHIGKNLIYFGKISSTNDHALKIIKEVFKPGSKKNKSTVNKPGTSIDAGTLDGLIILAEIQDKGRGRFNRKWISPAGGLWFTIILKTMLPPKDLPKVTFIAAYSIAEALNNDFGIQVNIKWPNDIYFHGKKLAGILTESENINGNLCLVLGMGINVNNDLSDLDKSGHSKTSLKNIAGNFIGRELLLATILAVFEKEYFYFCKTKDFKTLFKKIEKILT